MKYKELKKLLPKYTKNYRGNKPGDVRESCVRVYMFDSPIPSYANDAELLDKTVVSLVPKPSGSYRHSHGILIVELK